MGAEEEIQRLRDWKHTVTGEIDSFKWQIRQNSKDIGEFKKEMRDLKEAVDLMVEEDRIATQVAARIKTRNRLELTWLQRLGGMILFAMTIADFIKGYFG